MNLELVDLSNQIVSTPEEVALIPTAPKDAPVNAPTDLTFNT